MAYEIESLKKIRYYVEPNGSYATNNEANIATQFTTVKAVEATAEVNTEQLTNETMMQRIDAQYANINARKRCNLSLTSYLNGTSQVVSKSVSPATTYALPNILATIMGAVTYSNGTGLRAASATGLYSLDSASTFKPGTAIGMYNSTYNRLECARVQRYDSTANAVTTSLALSFTPASGATVYGGSTCYLTQDPNKSLQFYVEGVNPQDKYVLMGLQGGISFKFDIGALSTVTFDLKNGANWVTSSDTSTALSPANYSDAMPPPFVNGLVYAQIANSGSTGTRDTLSTLDCFSFEITPAIDYLDVTTEGGTNNILRKRRNRTVPIVAGKFVTYETGLVARNFMAIRDNNYSLSKISGSNFLDIGLQVGTEAGNTVFLSMPQCQVVNVQRVDAGGLAGVEVSFEAHESDVAIPAGSDLDNTDLAKSAFSIHFL